ncbi:hypothetical protein OJF2_34490 [Aquisphaera giovannonii]|uniref:Uncharacterized protein n=1 Tax=Aquisphaera giovannonii TaxID=406548 RepID=A0A5B9W3S9_9BACT|nr:hypothetical protein [Aquisphaera giovannonii]QEH34904.1 hypothetical protein OJF2_34490 [Aquisphaera giovannonii]
MRIIPLLESGHPDVRPDLGPLAGHEHPWTARKGRMLLDLVAHLESRGPAPDAFAYVAGDELWLYPANRHNRARVQVAVVWRDYGPVRDGYPEMYYRLSVRRPGAPGSEERARELSEVEDHIRRAFGWSAPAASDPA